MAKRKTRGRGRGRGKSASANVTSESENSVLKTPRTDAEGEETDASTVSKRSTRSKSGGDKEIPAKKAKTEDAAWYLFSPGTYVILLAVKCVTYFRF